MYVQIMYRNLYVFVLTSMLCDFGFAKFAHAASCLCFQDSFPALMYC